MAKCKHQVFYIHQLSSIISRIVDNKIQYSDTSKDGYRVICYSCGYDRTFNNADKLPQWVTNKMNIDTLINCLNG